MKQRTASQLQNQTMTATLKPGGILQRKCACGQHTVAGRDCEECRKKGLQRKAAGHTSSETVTPIIHEVLRSPGQPLDDGTKLFMEEQFGQDFSGVHPHTEKQHVVSSGLTVGPVNDHFEQEANNVAEKVMWSAPRRVSVWSTEATKPDLSQVRVHTGTKAAESAEALNALAYTVGRDIVFGAGQYTPRTKTGKNLLAHELVHVMQQAGTERKNVAQRQNGANLERSRRRPLGPIAQARADALAALNTAATRVQTAIVARDSGETVPNDVTRALSSYFPQETSDFLDLMLRRIRLTHRILEKVRIRSIRGSDDINIATDPVAELHLAALEIRLPARAFPQHHYIAVYPRWYTARNLRPTRLVHEIFHYVFDFIKNHPRNTPRANAFAYQGFVSLLGDLQTGSLVESYATEAE